MPIESHRDGLWELPEGWVWARLGDVCKQPGRIDPARQLKGHFHYIDVSALNDGRVTRPQDLAAARAPSRARQSVRAGDTLLSCVRVYLRNNALVPEELDGAVASTAFCVLRPTEVVDPRYVFWFVNSGKFTDVLVPLQRGNSPPAVLDEDVRDQFIPVAPIAEQRRIATRIDELFTEIGDGETALSQARDDLDSWYRALLKAAVTGQLTREWRGKNQEAEDGEHLLQRLKAERSKRRNDLVSTTLPKLLRNLPSGWGVGTLEEVAAAVPNALVIGPFGSNLVVSDYRDCGVPLVFVRHIRANNFEGLSPKFVSTTKAVQLSPHLVRSGDVLITKMGEPPGDVAIYPSGRPDAVITADCIKLTPHPDVPARWIQIVLSSEVGRSQIRQITKGVAQQKVNLANFRKLLVPVPSRSEMTAIVRTVDEKEVDMPEIEETRAGRALRQAILKAAFEGKLLRQNRQDEPMFVSQVSKSSDAPGRVVAHATPS